MSKVTLNAPEGCVVWSGTWKSSRFPNFVKGRLQVFAHRPEFTETYETDGYLTFEGCVKNGCVYGVCGNVVPGSDPLTTGVATAQCGPLEMELNLTNYNDDVTHVEGTYKITTRPYDEGTVWLNKTEREAIEYVPKSSVFTIFGF